jgi:predicted enzyme related to lactoylglutathione lyase
MLRGLTTTTFFSDDMPAAIAWYRALFEIDPYFVRPDLEDPAYAEFRIGDYQHEFGIVDSRYAPAGSVGRGTGAIAYWHVDDIDKAVETLLDAGATVHEAATERGPGYVTASVVDPFGNVLGVMFNQHYLDVLDRRD